MIKSIITREKCKVTSKKGITLIALVVTIIVLLILAGISIQMLTGQNGILKRAEEAKIKTEIATEQEQIEFAVAEALTKENLYNELTKENLKDELVKLFDEKNINLVDNSNGTFLLELLEENRRYIISNEKVKLIDLEEIFKNAKAPDEQQIVSKDIIGIGAFGEQVNMDLWEYTLLEDGSIGLNDEIALQGSSEGRSSGYLGNLNEDGTIIGVIPMYISIDKEKNFRPVTSLVHTFYKLDIVKAPPIPSTVVRMSVAFYYCEKLTEACDVPNSVETINYTFSNCSSLENMPNIGKNVKNMIGTFQDDTSLKNVKSLPDSVTDLTGAFFGCDHILSIPEIPKNAITLKNAFTNCQMAVKGPTTIPNKVENLTDAFYNCHKLVNPPKEIPASVKSMDRAFKNCNSFNGTIEVNANPDSYADCFMGIPRENLTLIGSSDNLDELKEQLKVTE